ncbi:MAG: hypothetical protein ACK5Y2_08050 [Bdellovibrionales bacterium]
MTLSQLMAAGVFSMMTLAQAYIVPDDGRPGNDYRPRPGEPVRPGRPGEPGRPPVRPDDPGRPGRPGRPPVRPDDPGRPGQPPPPAYPGDPYPGYPADPYPGYPGGQVIRREAYLNRIVRHEVLPLRRLADIDRNYRGFRVDRVHVILRPHRFNQATLELILDRRVEDSRTIYNESSVLLYSRGYNLIGEDVGSIQLGVRGEAFIERVIIEMSPANGGGGGYEPHPPGYGGEFLVQLPLPSYIPPQGHLDLTPYIDVRRYYGFTLVGLEITANAVYNAAFIDVLINSFHDGTVSLSRFSSNYRVISRQRLVLGSSFGSLVLAPRGDTHVHSVRLILRR